ncbi:MAG TPA: class I SAM-dependent methyltransferase [Anaerolineales bacterium]|nr:class I SAM-dependent methyltransferase [Anaerolineales bacterium]
MSDLTWDTLYTDHADAYETLVSHEDYEGNLPRAIETIQPLAGGVAAEFGCGTGRVTGLLTGRVRRIHSFDLTLSMLRMAQQNQARKGWENATLAQADSRCMPVRSGWADFAIQGWAFLQIAVWHWDDWQIQLGRALDEMGRLVRPGGKLILIETLGTGELTPNPAAQFRTIYDFLEQERGFRPQAIRTDYRFENMGQIDEVVLPLFGIEMLERLIRTPDGIVVPECTGLWWKDNPAHDEAARSAPTSHG